MQRYGSDLSGRRKPNRGSVLDAGGCVRSIEPMIGTLRKQSRITLVKLAVALVLLVLAGVALATGLDVRAWMCRGMDYVRSAGPVFFFFAMALAPVFGVPMLMFTVPVLSLFAPTLGTGLTVFLSLMAVTTDVVVSYCLARWVLQPPLRRLVGQLGYCVSQVDPVNATDMMILLRVMPGIPFFIQNYIAGLAGVSLSKYLIVTSVISLPINAAHLFFGDALLHGRGKMGLLICSVLATLAVGAHILRKNCGHRKKVAK